MNKYKQQLLIDASILGDTIAVNDLIKQPGVHAVWGDQTGRHPIHYAAMSGKNEVIAILLRYADVWINQCSGKYWTPLHFAVDQIRLATIEYLVSKGADCNAQNLKGETPLHRAFFKLQQCDHKSGDCPLRDMLNGCTQIVAIFHEQAKSLKEKCVILAIAEFLVRKGNGDLYVVNRHNSPTFYYTRFRYEEFHEYDKYFEALYKSTKLCESCLHRTKKVKVIRCLHELCAQCYLKNDLKCIVCVPKTN